MIQHRVVHIPREEDSPQIVELRSPDRIHREGRIVGHREVVADLEPSHNG